MDLVVRLLGESASYTATMARGTADAGKLDQRLETLTTTMQRQALASQASARERQVLAIADQGASASAAEYALSIARQLDQEEQLAQAEQRLATQRRLTAAENQEWISKAIQASHQEARAYSEVAIVQRLKEAATRGATQAQLDEIATAYQVTQRNNQLAAAYRSRAEAARAAGNASNQAAGGFRNSTFAVQALAFGVQDAAQVYGTTGLAGAISASANNMIFFLSLINPTLGTLGALVVAGGQFAAILGPMALGLQNNAERTKQLVEEQKRQLEIQQRLNDMIRQGDRASEAVKDAEGAKGLREQRESTLRDNRQEQQQIQDQVARQRALRAQLQQNVRDTESNQTGFGIAANTLGLTQRSTFLAQIKALNETILEQENRRAELQQQELLLQRQVNEAKEKETRLTVQQNDEEFKRRSQERNQAFAEQQAKEAKDRQEAQQREFEQYQRERAEALKQANALVPEAQRDQMSDIDAKRHKIAEEYAERMRRIDEWKRKQLLTDQEVFAAQTAAYQSAQAQQAKITQEEAERKKAAEKTAQKEREDQEKKLKATTSENRGVATNSQEALKAVWDATDGGKNGAQEAILQATQANGKKIDYLVQIYRESIKVIEKLGTVKSK